MGTESISLSDYPRKSGKIVGVVIYTSVLIQCEESVTSFSENSFLSMPLDMAFQERPDTTQASSPYMCPTPSLSDQCLIPGRSALISDNHN